MLAVRRVRMSGDVLDDAGLNGIATARDGSKIYLTFTGPDEEQGFLLNPRARLHPGGIRASVPAAFEVSQRDSPMSRTWAAALAPTNSLTDTLVYFALLGGLRIVDVADPLSPREIGYFSPSRSSARPNPQHNDVDIDDCGVIYLADGNVGFDILGLRR